jgi:hypothetical protein
LNFTPKNKSHPALKAAGGREDQLILNQFSQTHTRTLSQGQQQQGRVDENSVIRTIANVLGPTSLNYVFYSQPEAF